MTHTTWSLFEEPYWLDCIAPGQWDAIEIKEDGDIVGRMPYVMRQRLGLSYISNPLLTPTLGPWVRSPANGKYTDALGHQHRILEEIISRLPDISKYDIICAPEFTNVLAFHWAGFNLSVGYTYRITDLSNIDLLWSNLASETRSTCRRAEKQVVVETDGDLAKVLTCIEKTYDRQGTDISHELRLLERVDEVMSQRNQRKIYIAHDAQGRVHAAYYCVFDERHTFCLVGGADPEQRSSGAQSLLLWEIIKDAAQQAPVLDFTGSVMPKIEPFIRRFGGQQVFKMQTSKKSTTYRFAEHAREFVRA